MKISKTSRKKNRHRRWSVVPSMRRQLAATRRDPETASGRHYQGPIISQDSPNPGEPGGWAACTAALSSPPVSLTTSNNGRSGAAKQPAQPKKNLPLFAVVRRRSNSHPRLQGKSAKQERTWKRGVLHTVYSLQKKKKEAWTEFVVVASRGRSVGVGWRGGLEERTNAVDILLWCLVGGGRVTQGPLVWV